MSAYGYSRHQSRHSACLRSAMICREHLQQSTSCQVLASTSRPGPRPRWLPHVFVEIVMSRHSDQIVRSLNIVMVQDAGETPSRARTSLAAAARCSNAFSGSERIARTEHAVQQLAGEVPERRFFNLDGPD